jgi:hypothetical protein
MSTDEMFLGYCYLDNGTYPVPVHLRGIEAVMSYIILQLPLQHRVIICDSDDYRIFESQDGKILFP